jgi:hypothetical protein
MPKLINLIYVLNIWLIGEAEKFSAASIDAVQFAHKSDDFPGLSNKF